MKRKTWVIAATAAAALALVGGAAGVATAEDADAKSATHVDGLDAVTDDFNDHFRELGGPLCDECRYSQDTDLVVMWQSILVVDGFLPEADQVDGYFGPDTKRATAMWQDHFGVPQTGQVDKATWNEASTHLSLSQSTVYYGSQGAGELRFTRHDDGHYTYNKLLVSGAELANTGGDKIQFYSRTITLTEV